ncbi:MAG TPA: GNAT family N-acetyltransferase [Acidiferrobacteraceae bacterium]|nr:GNAT family N-acetyltransferase [Acidiferrobacteraceae bacterium]
MPQEVLQNRIPPAPTPRLHVTIAQSPGEIDACLRLRYRIFVDELGAHKTSPRPDLDVDEFDEHCMHLMVRDRTHGQLVGTTRLLTSDGAASANMYYSQSEFDLTRILCLPGRFMEIGRTCIDSAYRSGSALAVLWHGLAHIMVMQNIDYLIGCASIPVDPGLSYVATVMAELQRRCYAPEHLRVYPRVPMAYRRTAASETVNLPPLLKGYIHSGAMVCGEPAWDEAFNVADVFILLERDRLNRRYARHFVHRIN